MAVTMADVAKLAGVGVGTVSRVINKDKAVSDKSRKKVLEAIEALAYKPNRIAASLKKNETKIIALLVPVIDHPFFARFAEFVADEADKFGYTILLVSSQGREQREAEILDRIRRREVDGAVFVTHFTHSPEDFAGCEVVSFDRILADDIPYVTSDNYDSTMRALEYLFEHGARKIGFVGSKPLVQSEVSERHRAYEDFVAAHALESRSVYEVISHGEEGAIADKFLADFGDSDGIFASNYTIAHVLYDELVANGVKLPDDVQLISYDVASSEWHNGKTLTCVEQPVEQLAREVVRLLVKKMAGEPVETRNVYPTRFIDGCSTKK